MIIEALHPPYCKASISGSGSYLDFLKTKQKTHILSGFDVDEKQLNNKMFDFQKFIVKRALKAGKYAIFADCGLGKTLMQLEWANQVCKQTKRKVLILAPLAVVGQTMQEGLKFGIDMENIDVQNYEQLNNIDCSIKKLIIKINLRKHHQTKTN
jgi:reverse gyrase